MKNRKAFDLKNVMMIYNLLQVIVNTALGIYVRLNEILQFGKLIFIYREFCYS